MPRVVVSSIRPVCRSHQTIDEHLAYVLALVDEAGRRGSDVACLPEDVLFQRADGEPVDGPIHQAFGARARQHRMNLVVPIIEEREGNRYNASLIFDRAGTLVGRYDKTHLIRLERIEFGLLPGNGLPVFELDGVTIGVMVCADALHPEVARTLALRGAKIIFFPHQMAEPGEEFWNTMVRSRAQDNCVWVVSCSFGVPEGQPYQPQGGSRPWYPNVIVAPDGRIAADGGGNEGMTTAAIDPTQPRLVQDYIEFGPHDLWDLVLRYRRPELYKA